MKYYNYRVTKEYDSSFPPMNFTSLKKAIESSKVSLSLISNKKPQVTKYSNSALVFADDKFIHVERELVH